MKYKLIAVDMDGTLLTDDKRITDRTVQAVRRASDAGIYFCLSTGRPLCAVSRYLDQLGIATPTITYNGAVIVDPATGERIYEQGLEPEAAKEIWAFGHRFGTTICVWAQDMLYVSEVNERTEDYKKISGLEPIVITDFDRLADGGITKMLWYDDIEKMPEFQRILGEEMINPVNYATSNPRFLEFIDRRVSKATAMERLGQHLGITRDEMMAIGDGHNDLPMLTYAGLGVAMGNAPDDIRKVCGHVTASNQEDGVAKAIEELCLN